MVIHVLLIQLLCCPRIGQEDMIACRQPPLSKPPPRWQSCGCGPHTAMQKAVDIPEVRSVASPYPLDCRSCHSTGTIFPRPHLLVADSSYISLSLITNELRRTLGGLSLGEPTCSAGKVVSTNRSRHSCLEQDTLEFRVAPKNMRARDT